MKWLSREMHRKSASGENSQIHEIGNFELIGVNFCVSYPSLQDNPLGIAIFSNLRKQTAISTTQYTHPFIPPLRTNKQPILYSGRYGGMQSSDELNCEFVLNHNKLSNLPIIK
jgi:hypothetical protein